MASVTRENGSPSEEAFMDEIINAYHPDYKTDSRQAKRKNVERARRGNFQLSQLLEETIELRSREIRKVPLKNVNIDGMDFDDGSDLKSCTFNYRSQRLMGVIAGLKNKTGDIRVILWNDFLKMIEFYFIPKEDVNLLATGGRIDFSASTKTGVIKKLVEYRCETFDDLVLC